jgi:hypothetical protein
MQNEGEDGTADADEDDSAASYKLTSDPTTKGKHKRHSGDNNDDRRIDDRSQRNDKAYEDQTMPEWTMANPRSCLISDATERRELACCSKLSNNPRK